MVELEAGVGVAQVRFSQGGETARLRSDESVSHCVKLIVESDSSCQEWCHQVLCTAALMRQKQRKRS